MDQLSTGSATLPKNFRAIGWGAAVIVGGSLVMNTVVGIAAISGMLARGENPATIAAQLPSSTALAVFTAAGGILMSLAGGYAAATIAKISPMRHALAASILAMLITFALLPFWGDSTLLDMLITAVVIAAIVPCAMIGAWLATPIKTASVEASIRV